MYRYGNHLTPGLTEVRSYAAFFTAFLAEGLRVRFWGTPALKASQGVLPSMPRPQWGRRWLEVSRYGRGEPTQMQKTYWLQGVAPIRLRRRGARGRSAHAAHARTDRSREAVYALHVGGHAKFDRCGRRKSYTLGGWMGSDPRNLNTPPLLLWSLPPGARLLRVGPGFTSTEDGSHGGYCGMLGELWSPT